MTGLLLIILTGPCLVFGGQRAADTDWSHIPHSETFDVVTWNIEWFGDEDRGPKTDTQFQNVIQVIQELRPDLIGVQEIADAGQFNRLMDKLDDYRGFITRYSQDQQVGFIFNTETVDSLTSRLLGSEQLLNAYHFAYRFPLEFVFQARIGDDHMVMNAVVQHAKASRGMNDSESYERRVNASTELKEYFDFSVSSTPLIYLGDYNDPVTQSNYEGAPSPYQNFVADPAYEIVTLPLEEAGEVSWPGTDSRYGASMIDHITINQHLSDEWLRGSETVYYPDDIEDFENTTSDHHPVSARFDLTGTLQVTTAVQQQDGSINLPQSSVLLTNYPNPFNPSTMIPFHLRDAGQVTIAVYNALGQRVATPVRDQHFAAGSHTIPFEASHLSSGLYIYEMRLSSGYRMARTMQLVK